MDELNHFFTRWLADNLKQHGLAEHLELTAQILDRLRQGPNAQSLRDG